MFEGDQADLIGSVMAARAAAAMAELDNPSTEAPKEAVRRGARVADLNVDDTVHRYATEFGRVIKKGHEVDDVQTGIPPTCQLYVTIQWGPSSCMRYTDETLDWYGVQKVPMPTAP